MGARVAEAQPAALLRLEPRQNLDRPRLQSHENGEDHNRGSEGTPGGRRDETQTSVFALPPFFAIQRQNGEASP